MFSHTLRRHTSFWIALAIAGGSLSVASPANASDTNAQTNSQSESVSLCRSTESMASAEFLMPLLFTADDGSGIPLNSTVGLTFEIHSPTSSPVDVSTYVMTTSAFVNRIDDPTNPINQYFQPAISTYTERLTTAPGFVLMCNAAASRVPDFPDIWDPQPFPADTTLVIARGGTAIASASLAGKQPFDFSGAPLTQALIDIIGVGLPQDCLDNNLAECTYFTDVYNGLIQVTGRRLALKYAYALVAFSVWLWYPEGQIQNSAAEIVSSMDAPSADEYCGDYFLNAATLTVSGGQPIYE
ncbi:MAG: hypothetical protein RIR69_462, partial [Actinomycetota bacterium]